MKPWERITITAMCCLTALLLGAVFVASDAWLHRYEIQALNEDIGLRVYDRWSHEAKILVLSTEHKRLVVFSLGNLATPAGIYATPDVPLMTNDVTVESENATEPRKPGFKPLKP